MEAITSADQRSTSSGRKKLLLPFFCLKCFCLESSAFWHRQRESSQTFTTRTTPGWGPQFVLLLLVAITARPVLAQETVTILKSRLQELERKEIELEKLKGEFKSSKGENVQLKKQHQDDAVKISSAPPAQSHETQGSPPMASLPPLAQGEPVDAVDLANHYRADAAVADRRYRKRTFEVRGEVAAFERLPFIRDYRILLKTADRELRVVCELYTPEKYSAVLTIKNGSELVGQTPGRDRIPIAKVGDIVFIEGQCRGLRDGVVRLSGCELKSVR
jgi:hypothetical protein